ncbi:MAG: ABC transporter permease subunit [Polyangiaceae bacterium]
MSATDAPKSLRDLRSLEKGSSLWADAWKRLRKNRVAVVSGVLLVVMLLVCILHPMFSSYAYDKADLKLGPTPPSSAHWLGTDTLGRDLLARLTFGGRISFAVGVISTIVSFTIGVAWGGIAGYFGGRVDALMMRIVDVLYTLPLLILVILLMVFFGNDKSSMFKAFTWFVGLFSDHPKDPKYFPIFQITLVFFAIGMISWLTMARIVRGQVIALRGQLFVEAAKSIGVGDFAIVFRHLVPNALGPIIVYTTLTIPEVMLTEAFLSFLGLGTQEPLSSWGQLASNGADTMSFYPWLLTGPAVALAITLFCFNFLGDGLRDALDPRIRKEG